MVEAMFRADPTEYKGKCPVKISFTGRISVLGGNGRVSYRVVRSDGASAPIETIHFSSSGTKDIEVDWTIGGPSTRYEGWQSVKILEPQEMESNKAYFKIQCDAAPGPDVASVKILSASCISQGPNLYKVEMHGEAAGPKGAYFSSGAAPYVPGPPSKFSTTCGRWSLLPGMYPRCQRKGTQPFKTDWSATHILNTGKGRPSSGSAYVFDDSAESGAVFRPIVSDSTRLNCQ